MCTVTVLTPTYNRIGLLPRLYQSLLEQENKDLCWLIVDDGSVDGTSYNYNTCTGSGESDHKTLIFG